MSVLVPCIPWEVSMAAPSERRKQSPQSEWWGTCSWSDTYLPHRHLEDRAQHSEHALSQLVASWLAAGSSNSTASGTANHRELYVWVYTCACTYTPYYMPCIITLFHMMYSQVQIQGMGKGPCNLVFTATKDANYYSNSKHLHFTYFLQSEG